MAIAVERDDCVDLIVDIAWFGILTEYLRQLYPQTHHRESIITLRFREERAGPAAAVRGRHIEWRFSTQHGEPAVDRIATRYIDYRRIIASQARQPRVELGELLLRQQRNRIGLID